MMNKLIYLLFGSILLLSCATISTPSGGEKDRIPPVETMTKPISETVNFKKKSFEIKFDEFIVDEDFADKILISPAIESIKSKYTGRGVVMSWNEDLLPNTTYNFQFLNTIKDFNENNVLAGYQYTFSTGNVLDSMSVHGQVENSTFEKLENIRVCLVHENEYNDSTYLKSEFNYATFADEQGHFTFNYLPEGHFYLYTYSDKNLNDLWDEEEDFIGFFPHKITTLDTLDYHLKIFKEDINPEFVNAKHSGFNQIELEYQKAIPNYKKIDLFLNKASINNTIVRNEEKVILMFNENLNGDSLTVLVDEVDTFGLYKTKYKKPNFELIPERMHGIKGELYLMKTNFPVNAIDTSKIKTVLGRDSIVNMDIRLLEDKHTIAMDIRDFEGPLGIEFNDSSLVFMDSLFSEKKEFRINQIRIEDLAIIQCVFKKHEFPFMVELYNTKNELIESKYLPSTKNNVSFEKLNPGNYKVRYIIDENADSLYTSGSIKNKRQPEVIINYKEELSLKPNWITEIVF